MTEISTEKYRDQLEVLINTAILGLEKMYDPDSGLFAKRVIKSGDEFINNGVSRRYTLMNLLGLNRALRNDISIPMDISFACQKQFNEIPKYESIGEVGLAFWLFAQYQPQNIGQLLYGLNINEKMQSCADARKELTVELSWLLTGLSELFLQGVELPPAYANLADQIFHVLKRNYAGQGIFKHSSGHDFFGRIKRNIGSFADQVYPIMAFAKYSRFRNDEAALAIARDAANKMVSWQGNMGQWWWHYYAPTGKIFSRYPVYSVHQDAMGPMALFEVGKLTGDLFPNAVQKSVDWVFGNNEFATPMIDAEAGLIWRNIRPWHFKRYASIIAQLIKMQPLAINAKDLHILFECWSYHLGWVLYAFSEELNRLRKHANG